MSQLGEAHRWMLRQMEWVKEELAALEPLLEPGSDAEYHQKTANLHLEEALRIARHIDSGTVYEP